MIKVQLSKLKKVIRALLFRLNKHVYNPCQGYDYLICDYSCEIDIHKSALIKCKHMHGMLNVGPNSTVILGPNSKIELEMTFSFGRGTTLILHENATLSLGANSWALHSCWIEVGANQKVDIGRRTTLQLRCGLHGDVTIGDDTLLAPDVFVSSGGHSFDNHDSMTIREQDKVYSRSMPVSIGSNCWLGIRSWVAPGILLADGTILGANSVITKDTESYSVYAGVPARKIRKYRK